MRARRLLVGLSVAHLLGVILDPFNQGHTGPGHPYTFRAMKAGAMVIR